MENNFISLFASLILDLQKNNIDNISTTVANLNTYLSDSIETLDYGNSITEEDLYYLGQIASNESFDYFLQNYKPVDFYTKRALLNLKFKNMESKLNNLIITQEDFNNFVMDICTNTDEELTDYEYLLGIRAFLSAKDYNAISKIKDIYLKEA